MDSTEFDHPIRAVAAATTRRTLTRMLATMPVIGASGVLVEWVGGEPSARAVGGYYVHVGYQLLTFANAR